MNDSPRGGGGVRGVLAGRVEKSDPHAQIASKLKALYQAVENEPVPEHFIDLLRRLDEAERGPSRE
ncbi:MAG TPA: NepR family anti-sigma factor [Sinorhizobium sp.]|nr:NepR family anti-sigma factor [Sinorhizobium sp.]